jgi:putative salt-induced outer membrane protein YdiY
MSNLRSVCLLLALCVLGGGVRADVVLTSDGSRLVGIIDRLSNGELIIETNIAGTVRVDASLITGMTIDRPVTVEFTSGDRLVGTIDSPSGDNTSTMTTALGEIQVKADQVVGLWPQGEESPEVVAAKQEVEETKIALRKEMEETRAKLTPKWSVTLEAGGSATEGNTNTLNGRGRLDVKRESSDDLLHFFLAARYDEQNNIRTTNEYLGGVNYERNVTDRWHWYTRIGLEFDEFENLDLRTTAAVGAGYYWIKKPEHELKTRVGAGFRNEAYNNGTTVQSAVVDLGFDYRLDVADWFQFTHSTTYSPDFQETADYRLTLDTAMAIPLKNEDWSLKFGVRNAYNSRPIPGVVRLDSTYYANLVFKIQ